MPGGLAGRSAAAPEMAHKVLRKAWPAHSFLNAKIMSGGKTQYFMVARGVIVGKAVFYRTKARVPVRLRKVLRGRQKVEEADRAQDDAITKSVAAKGVASSGTRESNRSLSAPRPPSVLGWLS